MSLLSKRCFNANNALSLLVSAILFSRFTCYPNRLKRSQENGSQEEEGSQAVVLVRTYICTANARAGDG